MKVINLFGGPGTGKSTTASDLFAEMKWNDMNVELVTEFAKDLSWEKRWDTLTDQLYVAAKQNHKLWRIKDQVDYCITDSPLIMGMCYTPANFCPKTYPDFIHDLWNSYDNINFFLKREKPFHQVGRHTTEDESITLDKTIKHLLDEHDIPYIEIPANRDARTKILWYINKLNDGT